MQKKIALITGASGGIGKAFTRLMLQEDVQEVWAIARNQDKLVALRTEFGGKIVPFAKDLSDLESLRDLDAALREQQPVVAYLVNNTGLAKMGTYADFTLEEIDATVRLNCGALVSLCTLCLPYMRAGSHILNISSASSFQPLPYLSLYAATKVFEHNYSRALNQELRETGITVTAVCPSWVDTPLLQQEANGRTIKFRGIVSAELVARTALRDAKRGKDLCVPTLRVKATRALAKLFPQKTAMHMWLRQLKNI